MSEAEALAMTARPLHSFLSFFSGKFPGKTLRRYLLFIAAVFGGLVAIALLLFPQYTFFDYSVSSLGAWHRNPRGWWAFSVAMWAMGIMVVPFFIHAKRKFEKYTPRFARLFRACVFVTSGGMITLGFFPESPGTDIVHYIAAGFIFIGFFVDACISWVSIGKMARAARPRQRQVAIIASLVLMIAAFWAIFLGMLMMYLVSRSAFLSSVYFWEWCYILVSIGLYLLLLEIVVSREPEP
jgi:hypothetical protein